MGLVCANAFSVAARAVDPPVDEALKSILPIWERTASVKASLGYRDNVALSHAAPRGSGFLRSTMEGAALRLPVDDTQLTFLITAEDTRYFSGADPDHENLVIAQGEVKRFWENGWEAALGLDGVYLDQVLDISVTETNRTPVPLQTGALTARPSVRRELPDRLWLALEAPATRQWFLKELDDYWEAGARLSIGSTYGHKSESSLGYAFTFRNYDTEPTRTITGQPIPGTHRDGYQHEMLWSWRHYWDAARHWRTTTKVSFRAFTGNGPSYFDYNRVGIAEQLRFRHARWELAAEVKFAVYQFDTQTVNATDPSKRQRTDLVFNLRGERELAKHWRVFAQYDFEQTFSNLTLDEYRVNTVSGGVTLEF